MHAKKHRVSVGVISSNRFLFSHRIASVTLQVHDELNFYQNEIRNFEIPIDIDVDDVDFVLNPEFRSTTQYGKCLSNQRILITIYMCHTHTRLSNSLINKI